MERMLVVFLCFCSTLSIAGTLSITDAGVKNLGSLLAYTSACEVDGLLRNGTTADFIFSVQAGLTGEAWHRVKSQFQFSSYERKQYSVAYDRWFDFKINAKSCNEIGKSIPLLMSAMNKGRP